ncbi:hypothetical protein BN168_570007 [Clostridioides difficile CD002]|nr:hypothetical protein BN167_1520003 [Clostridioides difficile E13]CCL07872.1 hypothetical protein BN168_570007 [Clostridioides difficile CD002]
MKFFYIMKTGKKSAYLWLSLKHPDNEIQINIMATIFLKRNLQKR